MLWWLAFLQESLNNFRLASVKLYTLNKSVMFFDTYCKYINTSLVYKPLMYRCLHVLRAIHRRSKLPLFWIWYTCEFRSAGKNEDTIIVTDSIGDVPANYLKSKYPKLRIIYWFWNHIDDSSFVNKLDQTIEKWSYDPIDCFKYGMKYNTQYYFKCLFGNISVNKIEQDVFYIGKNKGRVKCVLACKQIIENQGLSNKFIILEDEFDKKNWMPYETVVENILQSRCIVDIVSKNQTGLTLRPLEALFMHKKLITNFQQIKDYDFYCADNIFILDIDDESKLHAFIHSEYNHSVDKFIDKYEYSNWLIRFNE
ncbi:MAG: hypothetical protein R3Y59_05165 [bacterium]